MFTALVLMMLAVIAYSYIQREKQKKTEKLSIREKMARIDEPEKKPMSRSIALLLFVVGGSACLALGLMMDKSISPAPPQDLDQPLPTQTGPKSEPGPGWKVEHASPLPPSGFTGKVASRSEKGVSGKGFVVVGNGLFKRIGWRITGADAAYCSLDVELLARTEHRKLDSDGYSYTDMVINEGWHEAKVQAWCPPDHPAARFNIAIQTVDANGRPHGNGSWNEAGDDDIRHR